MAFAPEPVQEGIKTALYRKMPTFITVETTGVRSNDVITAMSVKTLGSETITVYTPVPSDKLEMALKFLCLSESAHKALVKVGYDGVRGMFKHLNTNACSVHGATELAPMTYNTSFQQKYIWPVYLEDAASKSEHILLDLTRMAWCVMCSPVFNVQPGTVPEDWQRSVEALTNRVRGVGYKQVFPAWDIDIPSPLRPADKPEMLEKLLLKLSGAATSEELLWLLGFSQPIDTAAILKLVNETNDINSVQL